MSDSLWMRLVDVGAALSGRAYASDGAIVFDVRDAVCPWNEGRWKLEGGVAARTDAAADLALDVERARLGVSRRGLVRAAARRPAGRGARRTGRCERADAIFGWRPLPWCPEIF